MSERTIAAGEFKAKCLALLDEVAVTGRPIVVTKRGKPVARVVAMEPPPSLRGSVTYLVDEDTFIAPLDEPWKADPT
ncbi:MAG: type II toxin-antitoxin system Phd/YefM family antitoxin [Gaiellaceae bacterium MAG52_C11]|nr:type II toxin-antitoxin system Phd/YefM family antitoxin [Candidatus Gaiellasilicea maunaloa]